jgi:glycine/D-amino acid oxidase-like deaminating enzyme
VSARAEVIIAGGGIVGLATAYQISMQYPHTKITVLEKESGVGQHQTLWSYSFWDLLHTWFIARDQLSPRSQVDGIVLPRTRDTV